MARTDLMVSSSIKCLAFRQRDGRLVLVGYPGDRRVRYGPLARALNVSRSSLKPASVDDLDELQLLPGGVVPIQIGQAVTIVFDASVPAMGLVYCGSGRADRSLHLEAADLVDLAIDPIIAEIVE